MCVQELVVYAVITVFFFAAGIACAVEAARLAPYTSSRLYGHVFTKMYQPCAATAVILFFCVLSLSAGKVIIAKDDF